jgi:flavin-dependent dehydrogenase
VIVLDQAVHPREKLCGGGVTHLGYNILTRLGLRFEPAHVPVREARLVYGGRCCSLYGDPVFRIVRRDEFDHWLVRVAEGLGVRSRQGEKVLGIRREEDFVEVSTTKATFRARAVVAADGSRSFVRRALNWDGAARVARALEVLTPEPGHSGVEVRDGVAVFDFSPLAEGLQGYTWDFPSAIAGRPFMNRGVFDSRACAQRPRADLKRILRESLALRERHLEDYALKGHPIRWWDRNSRLAMPRVLLAGDAAGVDPLVGEGISFALGYGEVAALAIDDAFARRDFSFAAYRDRLLEHPLFIQLDARVRLARLLYRIASPRLMQLVWEVVCWRLRRSPWRTPDFSADEPRAMRHPG